MGNKAVGSLQYNIDNMHSSVTVNTDLLDEDTGIPEVSIRLNIVYQTDGEVC